MFSHLKWVWLCELILDSDGDHFLFSPIFDRTPVSRDLDCYSLAKISEILAGADILSTPIFVMFSAWRAGTISLYSAGESPPIKAVRPVATAHALGDYTWRDQHFLGEVGKHQGGLGEISCCGLCRAKSVRRCFRACANILFTWIFCRRQHFVDENILSTPTFCCRQYFEHANILSVFRF